MDSRIKTLFERYFSGKCTEEEEKEIFHLISSGEFDDELKDAIGREDWDSEQFSNLSQNQLKKLSKVYHRLRRKICQEIIPERKRNIPYFIRIAAVFAGTFLLAAGIWYTFYNSPLQTVKTAYSEIRSISLPDGSAVTLNANSELKFQRSWKAIKDREVWLEGEAYFVVTHKKNDQKFIVHIEGLAIEVIGTEFNVKNRRKTNQIVLRSGKIKVTPEEAGNKSVLMKPGELLELAENNGITLEKVKPEYFSAWKNERLVFEKTPLYEIARMIEDNYGHAVTIENEEITTMTFTADIPSNKLDVLLEALSESYDMDIERKGDKIIFK